MKKKKRKKKDNQKRLELSTAWHKHTYQGNIFCTSMYTDTAEI